MKDQTMGRWPRRDVLREGLQSLGLLRPPPPTQRQDDRHSAALKEEEDEGVVVVEVEEGEGPPFPWKEVPLEKAHLAALKKRAAARRTPPADWPSPR